MVWKIIWSDTAARVLTKLTNAEVLRINSKLEQAAENPQHFLKRLSGQDDFKLRVGEYRIITLLIHSETVLFVEKIGHRKNIYK